jgi:hypothetical protein
MRILLAATALALLLLSACSGEAQVFGVFSDGSFTSGPITNTGTEVNGDVTLANDETIDNATDNDIRFTYSLDNAVLGEFVMESDLAGGSIEANNSFYIRFRAHDSGGADTDYGRIDFEIDDTTAASGEDSSIRFTVLDEAVEINPLEMNELGLTLQNGELLDNTDDSFVRITADDNQANWITLAVQSSNTGVANNETMRIDFIGLDSAAGEETYGRLEMTATDVSSAGPPDSTIATWIDVGGTLTLIETISATGVTIVGDVAATTYGGITKADTQTKSTTMYIGGIAATDNKFLFVAPYGVTIQQISIVCDTTTSGSGGSAYYTFQVVNLTVTEDLISAVQSTDGAEITGDLVYDLDPDQNLTLVANEVLELQMVKTGSPTSLSSAEIIAVVEYK